MPNSLPVMREGRLSLPVVSADEETLSEAIQLECGPVVYEVVKQERRAGQLQIFYRALPREAWRQWAQKPRRLWPLVPAQEKAKLQRQLARRVEIGLLGCVALVLLLALAWQLVQLAALRDYQANLRRMTVVPVGALPARPQEAWIEQMNRLQAALGPAKLQSFELDAQGGRIHISGAVDSAWQKAIAHPVVQEKEGVWRWAW